MAKSIYLMAKECQPGCQGLLTHTFGWKLLETRSSTCCNCQVFHFRVPEVCVVVYIRISILLDGRLKKPLIVGTLADPNGKCPHNCICHDQYFGQVCDHLEGVVRDYREQIRSRDQPPPAHPSRDCLVGIATRALLTQKGQRNASLRPHQQ
jgi:hypothetical protein